MIDSPWLLALFFLVALGYSSVGLGGGTSYTSLLVILGVGLRSIPTVSLVLNLVVTSVGSATFIRHHHARARIVMPLLASSIPMAYLGGSLALSERAFQLLLLGVLSLVALRIYFWDALSLDLRVPPHTRMAATVAVGAGVGFVAGAAGIGGGILLIPILFLLGLASEKEAAASGSILIWVNSLAGLAARVQHHPVAVRDLLPLAAAVLAGGAIGSRLGASRLSPRSMQRLLGVIVIVAIGFLLRRLMVG